MNHNREIIQSVLHDAHRHLSAIEIWELVRAKGESVSLATVYNSLRHLSASGAIKKIQISESNVLYDARLDRHVHLVCNACGSIADVDSEHALAKVEQEISADFKYKDLAAEITVRGLCPACQQ